jgi:branched-chain amino acid transport system ATP-binding protein
MSKTEESESISVALEITALNDFRGWLARDLPFFEKKRLMFATAIASRPKLLMLDEPAAGLSHEEGQELIEVVKKLKESEITIIIIEHVLPILFGVSDRLMILDAGEVVIIDTPEVVAKDSKVIAAYLGERRRDKRP